MDSYYKVHGSWYKIQVSRFKSSYSFHVFKFSRFTFSSETFLKTCSSKSIFFFQFKNWINSKLKYYSIDLFQFILTCSIYHTFISILISGLLCSCVKKSRNWKMVVYIVATIVFTKWNPMSDFNTNICGDCS